MIRTTYVGLSAILLTAIAGAAALAQVPSNLPKAPAGLPGTPPSATVSAMATDTMSTNLPSSERGTAADSVAAKLDAAVAAANRGDKAAAANALNAGVAAAETQAATSKGDFKDKLMSQAGNLKKLIPGVSSGLVGGNVLSKAVSLVKMALGANQISNLLGDSGSLLGSVGALTGGLNLLKGALPAVGGGQATAMGGTLISNALSSVGKLSGAGGAAAEPAVRQQLGGVLSFAKRLL